MASRTLTVELIGDARGAVRAMGEVKEAAEGMGGTFKRVGEIAAGFLAANVIGAGFDKLKGFIGESLTAAADLEQSIGGVQSVFGNSAQDILRWGETAHSTAGLSKNAFNEIATATGAFLQNYGMDSDAAAQQTIELTQRAADMAATFGGPVSEAMAAIQAGLRGQADPLERYGVSLSAAKVESHALAMTGKTTTSMLTDQEKMAARLDLVFQQTSKTAGQFAREEGTAAGQAERLAAKQENLAAQLGTKLLPIQVAVTRAKLAFVQVLADRIIPAVGSAMGVLGELAGTLRDRVEPVVRDIAVRFRDEWWPAIQSIGDTLRSEFEPVLRSVFDFLSGRQEVLQAIGILIGTTLVLAFGALAVSAGLAAISVIAALAPFIAVAVAVTALVAGLIYAYREWEAFRNVVDTVAGALQAFGEFVVGVVQEHVVPALQRFADFAGEQFNRFLGYWDSDLRPALENLRSFFTTVFDAVREVVVDRVGAVIGYFRDNWHLVMGIVQPVVDQFVTTVDLIWTTFSEIVALVIDLIQGDWSGAWENAKDIVGGLEEYVVETFENILSFLQGIVALVFDAAWNIGKAIGEGIANAIRSMSGAIGDAIRSAIPSTVNVAGVDISIRPFISGALNAIPGANITRGSISALQALGLAGFGAEGAIVTRPTLAMIGEAGSEAVVPLNRMPGASRLPSGIGGGGITINITAFAPRAAADAVLEALNQLRREGVLGNGTLLR